ncbi:MAG: hypothetical protein PWR03_50 [Tenuifilum sp.]|jgi:hypothetical protein|uniref:hypothetical protein n=1 Tax=Tenuifilum sp. TaxID=2760880 RepID=UPI0024AA4073|nr:hypothetical protein [Tenuifilum sp.]MDI3525867.1 hypothetical protein [Tenuifilum sp.]
MEYIWYSKIDSVNDLQQGDFIPNCPIIVPPASLNVEEPEVEIKLIDSIVLSQSCDLANKNIDIVLVCPYYSLKTFIQSLPAEQTSSKKAVAKIIDNLRKGFLPGYHLLNKSSEYFEDYQVVDFRNVYGIQIDSLLEICKSHKDRIRLLPPYREHLSQSFARYFMRVGLPQDILIEGY